VSVVFARGERFDSHVPVLIIGAGACGLVAALAARDAGAEVLVLERDATPAGSTALSSGFIPAAHTRFQREKGIADSPERFASDLQRKNHGAADPRLVEAICRTGTGSSSCSSRGSSIQGTARCGCTPSPGRPERR
jgi:fumarate reductase flavoprotein subunit